MTPRPATVRVALLTPLLAFACVSGCGRTPPGGPGGAGDGPGAVPVTVVTLKEQPISLARELPGRTAAFRVAEVRPQVSGIVERRLFDEGSLVKAGQVTLNFEGDALARLGQSMATLPLVMRRREEDVTVLDLASLP